jgi:pyruvate/2-oxoglutarate dehydrogenase complex dihydrolipoamide acyltransferase (E2) component
MNASFDAATGTRKLNPTVDVSVAVATPGGLITPIVTNVDQRGLVGDGHKAPRTV